MPVTPCPPQAILMGTYTVDEGHVAVTYRGGALLNTLACEHR